MDRADRDLPPEGLAETIRALRDENAALRRSEAVLLAAIEVVDQPVYAKDERGRYTLANSATGRVLGRPVAQILGRSDADLFPEESARRIVESDRRIIDRGRAEVTLQVATAAEVTRTYLTAKAPHRDDRGRAVGIVGTSRDLEECAGIEAELARQSEILRTIFDQIPVMISFMDPDGRVRLVNREWERVLGWSLEEARSLDMGEELYPDPDARRKVLDYILHPTPGWADFRTRVRDGRTIDTAWANVLLSDGTSIGFGLDLAERKRAEEAALAAERQFRAVFDSELDAMILGDEDGQFVAANASASELFGLPRERLLGLSDADFAGPGFALESIWAESRREGAGQGRFRLHRPDGSAREVEYSARAEILPGRHLAVLRDVTERVRAEEALRESERRVVVILESITDGFFALDRQWRFHYVNPQAGSLLGRSPEDLLGRDVWLEFPDAVGSAFDREYRRAMADRVSVEFEEFYPSPLGRWFLVHAYPSPDGLSVYFTDVTERRRAEEAVRRSERRFRSVLESSRDVIYQLDPASGTFDYVSPSARDVLGHSAEVIDHAGLPLLLSQVHPEDRARLEAHLSGLISPRPGVAPEPLLEYRIKIPGKGWRWMSDSLTVIRDESEGSTVVGIVRDVTDDRLASERLRDLSRRLIRAQEEERRRIARELHDEIGQALTAVLLNVRAVLRGHVTPSAGRRLGESIALVEVTIGQVRDLSLDLRPSMLDDLGLFDALRSYVLKFGERSGVEAVFVARDDADRLDPDVETACYRIAQEALTNVARHAGAGRVRVAVRHDEGGLSLTVADDGSGFDVEAAAGRAARGCSLGVLSMRERASLLGGQLEISSGPGRGTEVRASFPPRRPRPGPGSPDRSA